MLLLQTNMDFSFCQMNNLGFLKVYISFHVHQKSNRYFMSNISLEKMLSFKPLDVQLKLAVNNLFNEDYLSVLSRPMPGINFEFFIGITPKFGKSRK